MPCKEGAAVPIEKRLNDLARSVFGTNASRPCACGDVIAGAARIVDGDTLAIGDVKIRLEGIDAPETDQVCLDAHAAKWACGVVARDRLIAHIDGWLIECSRLELIGMVALSRSAVLQVKTSTPGWAEAGRSHSFAIRSLM